MSKKQKLIQQAISALLFAVIIGLLGWLSTRYKYEMDWTAGHRNTLTEASQKQLGLMKDPVKFTAFLYSNSDIRVDVQSWVERYQRFKKDVSIEFVDPSAQPLKVKEYNIERPGEVVVEYQGRRETLQQMSERTITGALQRLTYTGERYLVFLTGHGEHAVDAQAEQDSYSQLADALADKGLKLTSLNLTQTPKIPDNASALIIASPRNKLLDGEVKIISDYVAAGGNLLWLADPDYTPGMDTLAKQLGITWQNGYAIFPNYQMLGTGNPAIYLATSYPKDNPVTRELMEVTAFPLVRSLTYDKASGFNASPMLVTDESAWLETSKMADGPVSFDAKAGDIEGPLTIGLTLTREVPDAAKPAEGKDEKKDDKAGDPAKADKPATHPQRVALVGDADFMSNANLGVAGNRTLALDLMQWLAARDDQLNIDIPKAPDTSLYLPGWALLALAAGFVIVLPLGLIGYGVLRWAIRRRA